MNHPDWPAFLAAILAEPADNALRLVAADFLEEHGRAARAEFIRVQVALWSNPAPEADELRCRERAYLDPLSAHGPVWAAEECAELVEIVSPDPGKPLVGAYIQGADRLVWRRGFVERVFCSASEWLRHGAAVRSRNPVRQVALRLNISPDRDSWSLGLPVLRGLASVDFYWRREPPATAFIEWLREALPGTQITAAG
jgi:uncharacterized protein (TIGR02996 family)